MATSTLIILIVVALLVLTVGFVVSPYLRSKGYLNQQSVDTTKQILTLVKLVLQSIKFNNQDVKNEATVIFDISERVVRFIDQTMDVSNEEKKEFAVYTITEILKSLNIQLNDANKQLIEVGVESAVNILPQKK